MNEAEDRKADFCCVGEFKRNRGWRCRHGKLCPSTLVKRDSSKTSGVCLRPLSLRKERAANRRAQNLGV